MFRSFFSILSLYPSSFLRIISKSDQRLIIQVLSINARTRQARATVVSLYIHGQWATINNANETYPCVTGCATSWLISFQVCVHATELIRLAGVHEFIEERGIRAINLIRRFAEQASLDSRFNYRLPITSPRAFTFSFVLFHTLYEFYHFFPPLSSFLFNDSHC